MTQSPLSLSYDLLASDYLAARHAHDDIKVQIASIGLPNKAARVLDVGCGSLRETAYLVADVGAFVGIDASIGMLELAKHVCGGGY
jgi:ubiquinone/menaquinone biosynthesis C-methylase UbiE